MLEVTFYRDDRNQPAGFRASGHADFADYGEDIVCAAVSAILQAARAGLTEYARLDVRARQSPGELELIWREQDRALESLRAIAATAELAVGEIARRYPDHVKVRRDHPGRNVGGSGG
ncbi:MAG TPA: ribosomal-processing cysteine protease Prp [Candidatus Nitrosotalea sp.]|nr:ribosomal-processing cysteine protease Prp [Candidatus Nitrosotalea sp.]